MAENAAYFTIGGNDAGGKSGRKSSAKRTPTLPYIGRSFLENEFARAAKIKFFVACLRTGFCVYDVKPEWEDVSLSERTRRIDRRSISRLVTFGYGSFGSGNVFTSASGATVSYSSRSRFAEQSKAFAEDIAFSLERHVHLKQNEIKDSAACVLAATSCVSAHVSAGFMTDYIEAARMADPDFAEATAEAVARAVCVNLGVPFIEKADERAYPTLRRGDQGEKVKLLQYLLEDGGFPVFPDGKFGNSTLDALTEFQLLNGLSPSGTASPETYAKLLGGNKARILSKGDTGIEVLRLQQKLLSFLYPVTPNGIFGGDTFDALKDFQNKHSLCAEGIYDKDTREKLALALPRARLY